MSSLKLANRFDFGVFRFSRKREVFVKRFLCHKSNGLLLVDKKDALVDEEINIEISGLKPYAETTIRATCMTECKNNTMFQSFAHYKADSNGCISLRRDPSLHGTYEDVEPMGLFWSKIPLENQGITSRRIVMKDPSKPLKTNLDVYDGFLDLNMKKLSDLDNLCENLKPMDSVSLNRWYLNSEKVEEETVKVGRLRGSIFYPKTPGKFQGIIDMFGSMGGMMPSRAALLASHGFTTFSLPYFDYDDLPKDMSIVEIEYFEEALEWFSRHSKVKVNGIGLIATSLGGHIALLLASRKIDQVKAAICINSVDSIIMHPIMVDGKQIPYNPPILDKLQFTEQGHLISRACFYENEHKMREETLVPVEKIKCKLLLLASEDDKSVDSDTAGRRIMEKMKKYGKESHCDLVIYPKAGHLLEPPFMPHCSYAYHSKVGFHAAWGGIPKHHADAQSDAWTKVLNFCRKNI